MKQMSNNDVKQNRRKSRIAQSRGKLLHETGDPNGRQLYFFSQ